MTSSKLLRAHPMVKITCPACSARITIDPTASRGPIQCPRCLNHVDPSAPPEPTATAASPAPDAAPTAAEGTIAALRQRVERLEHEREQRLALQSDLELLTSENVSLKAALEGLRAGRVALGARQAPPDAEISGPHSPPVAPAAAPAAAPANRDASHLRTDRDALAQNLQAAEAALADAARLLARYHDLETRVHEMGAAYIRAVERVRELETPQDSTPTRAYSPAS